MQMCGVGPCPCCCCIVLTFETVSLCRVLRWEPDASRTAFNFGFLQYLQRGGPDLHAAPLVGTFGHSSSGALSLGSFLGRAVAF